MPKIFNKILCPVSFDRNSTAALKFADELADPDKSTLYLLHIVSVPRIEPIMLEPNPVLSEGIAERELEKLAKQHLTSSTSYRIMIRTGDPALVIVTVAEELNVDLIIMPTHGHTGIARMILGSVAERVVREAKRPVLTIRPGSRGTDSAAV
jgi:nucleotide-binding universal stress UspA family protein